MKALQICAPRTQKATGIKALQALFGNKTPDAYLVQSEAQVQDVTFEATWFARPCPIRPRAGFVDSRIVKSPTELLKVWRETQQADAKGEVILMRPIAAEWNACMLPGLVSVGLGHDGATAGKKACAFPLLNTLPPELQGVALDIGPGEVPHIELVHGQLDGHNRMTYWVQARSGPKVPAGRVDFIPEAMVIQKVVQPCEDLLEWETQVLQLKPGTVVWAPGQTLASHAAIHCIGAGVPFVTSRRPKVGEALIEEPWSGWDLAAVQQGMAAGLLWHLPKQLSSSYSDLFAATAVVLYGLHHAAAMEGPQSYWLGVAAGIMLKLGMHAAEIEMGLMGAYVSSRPFSNEEVVRLWQPSGIKDLAKHWKYLPTMTEQFFLQMNGSGCGGVNWGRCSYAAMQLANAMRGVAVATAGDSGQAAMATLLVRLNKAVDQAHNGGFWLNKFGQSVANFSAASNGSWMPLLPALPLLYEMAKGRPKMAAKAKQMMRVLRALPVQDVTFATRKSGDPCVFVNRMDTLHVGPWTHVKQTRAGTKVWLQLCQGDKVAQVWEFELEQDFRKGTK